MYGPLYGYIPEIGVLTTKGDKVYLTGVSQLRVFQPGLGLAQNHVKQAKTGITVGLGLIHGRSTMPMYMVLAVLP